MKELYPAKPEEVSMKFRITCHPVEFDVMEALGIKDSSFVNYEDVGKVCIGLVEAGYHKVHSSITEEPDGQRVMVLHFKGEV